MSILKHMNNLNLVIPSNIPEIAEFATQTFFRLGGSPSFDNPTNTTLSSEENSTSLISLSLSLSLSLSHYLLLMVILQPS
jgi:hypothetical protein